MNKNKLYNLIGDFSMSWWCWWSNTRFKDAIRDNKKVNDEDLVSTYKQVQTLVAKLYKKFKWTADGPDQLWDAMTPPPQNYQHYLDGLLKDDCDGFHALVYHCLYNSGIKCSLFTANAINSGHCILVFTLNSKWYVVDYSKVYKGYDTLEEAIDEYNKVYPTIYKSKEILFNGFVQYNYETGKWFRTSAKRLTEKEN